MDVCACERVCVGPACLLYNKHWSKTGPSCQATAVTTNNDYPLPAPQSPLHNHQRRGDPPLLGEQCIHEWASSSPKPTLISPLRARQSPSLCVFVYMWISANLCVSVICFPVSTTGPPVSTQTQNDSSPSRAGRLYTNQYIWTADFIKAKMSSPLFTWCLLNRKESHVQLLPGFFIYNP